ncbi:RNA polymerase II, partial [Ascosphaera acerosa]
MRQPRWQRRRRCWVAPIGELLLETARQQQQQQQQQQQDDDAVEAGQEEEEDEALQLQREWQRRLAQVADDEAEEEAAEAEAKTRHITYVHGKRHALRVSRAEARRTEEEAKLRLIRRKKLSLVVDLDQTIIQATVDPTVGEWQADPDNPNYDAVRDVQRFQLPEDAPGYTPEAAEKHRRRHAWLKSKNLGRSARAGRARGRAKSAVYDDDSDDEWKNAFLPHNGCWYYIKPRPGLREFLERASDMFEYHIYTMGTRSYAKAVARIVDPTRKYFGNRILSRDESGSLTIKNLRRIFPVDTKMVVVIDDRGDVWKWAKNLVKVAPFDFFVGIGDINSSYLPKKPVLEKVDKVSGAVTTAQGQQNTSGDDKEKPDGTADTSDQTAGAGGGSEETPSAATLVQIVTMGGGESPDLLQKQAEKRDEAIQHQVQERPLLQQQKALDDGEDVAMTDADAEADGPSSGSPAADDEAMSLGETDPTSTSSTSSVTTSSGVRSRQRLLKDDDTELVRIYQLLQQIHHEFYHVFDLNRKRMLETAGANSGADSGLDARTAADVDAMISSTTVAAASTPASSASTTKTTTTQIPVPTPTIPPRLIPDVKDVMHRLKVMVLEPVRLVFTSILPLGTDIENADLSVWARGFGAEVQTQINPKTTTHVIAGEPRTAKVKEALMWPRRIKIVRLAWLVDSLTRWEMLPERDYA